MSGKLRFGAFCGPHHPLNENPTLTLQRDLELAEHLDYLGFDELWYGEHHSAGWELIASPEIMIAAAAERTKRIKLGSAVTSVPYHHPLMIAERYSQLDHMTRGRVMLGMGPGSLASDAKMMGIPVSKQRDMMDEGIDVLVRLMRGETVTAKTDWFTLDNARIHMTPYSRPGIEMIAASTVSPTGSRAAGRNGIGMLSFGATSGGAFDALSANWNIAEDVAKASGQTVDRKNWRLVAPMHIAPTREQARKEVEFGVEGWADYLRNVAALPIVPGGGDVIDALMSSHMAVIGTPDDAVAQIKRLQAQSGGFGTLVLFAHNWADWAETKRSYEMFARFVIPQVDDMIDNRAVSEAECRANRPELAGQIGAAIQERIQRHIDEHGKKDIAPELIAALPPKA
ncbi:MAG: LLM class flavin-dependent oxidoreductase [Sphingomonadales bacterium]|uniref:LLM class flavin-dependent oxidoreductase n=1 Tax=Novosphingobium sp. AAP93 TaxID=1523427 RepID=UPI0006B92870|nr:LLM class flavin-dependent oxidoreductase [Novosphingobium sp. AAP93]KPF88280.1 monooxygenase [Novosphingobium sp. AAP93]MBU6393109.1 LLM class flavin-dependent oxidoreductase [Sphingomonadales bacterium]